MSEPVLIEKGVASSYKNYRTAFMLKGKKIAEVFILGGGRYLETRFVPHGENFLSIVYKTPEDDILVFNSMEDAKGFSRRKGVKIGINKYIGDLSEAVIDYENGLGNSAIMNVCDKILQWVNK